VVYEALCIFVKAVRGENKCDATTHVSCFENLKNSEMLGFSSNYLL